MFHPYSILAFSLGIVLFFHSDASSEASILVISLVHWTSQVLLVIKNPPANAGDVRDTGSIPGLGKFPGGGQGNPLQYSCLENPVDRGAWRARARRVTKSWISLKWLGTYWSPGQGFSSTSITEGAAIHCPLFKEMHLPLLDKVDLFPLEVILPTFWYVCKKEKKAHVSSTCPIFLETKVLRVKFFCLSAYDFNNFENISLLGTDFPNCGCLWKMKRKIS